MYRIPLRFNLPVNVKSGILHGLAVKARYSGQKLLLHLHFNALNIKTHSTRSFTYACGRAILCPSYTRITGSSPAPDTNVSSRKYEVCMVPWR
jgi:hypothetical protein